MKALSIVSMMHRNGGADKAQSGDFNAIVTDNDILPMNGLEFVRSALEIAFKGRIATVYWATQS